MKLILAILATIALMDGAAIAAPPEQCDVPQSFVESETDLTRVMNETKAKHRLDISVVGSGSSVLTGPDGARFAYPARLEDALKQRLTGIDVKVTAHVQPKQITANMALGLGKILSEDKPTLVIWQAGTADALSGVEAGRAGHFAYVVGVDHGGHGGQDAELHRHGADIVVTDLTALLEPLLEQR